MGVLLYLNIANESDEDGVILSRCFLEQVIYNWNLIFKHESFLTKGEIESIYPNECGEVYIANTTSLTADKREEYLERLREMMRGEAGMGYEREFLIREKIISEEIADRARDPITLLHIIRKIEFYMNDNREQLPLIHKVYKSEEDLLLDDDVLYLLIDGIQCNVEGDLYYEDDYLKLRNKIRIKSYGEHGGKFNFYVEVNPIVRIGGTDYLTKTISKAEEFAEEFNRITTFLEQAIVSNRKVLWEYC
ncbi:hypothetical protein Q0590_36660 [Rhodocytophaga aerolata]|uniref:Uncharacterized protein n=1 Tax=Rhodocytophaga aerolata TaxID=455078 RepID=A0ABT8RID4_9BACT|nr:hypothetical protein [Rhodocytophaga aerolata]MDO1451859.1 hypothetical protein [Rhodocytophaga aerolata]